MQLELVTVVVDEYDAAIDLSVGVLGFELVEDSAAATEDGRAKRWVVVRPPGAVTGLLLAELTASSRPRSWAVKPPGGSASSSASTTSTARTGA